MSYIIIQPSRNTIWNGTRFVARKRSSGKLYGSLGNVRRSFSAHGNFSGYEDVCVHNPDIGVDISLREIVPAENLLMDVIRQVAAYVTTYIHQGEAAAERWYRPAATIPADRHNQLYPERDPIDVAARIQAALKAKGLVPA